MLYQISSCLAEAHHVGLNHGDLRSPSTRFHPLPLPRRR
jgi:hypothetical protein